MKQESVIISTEVARTLMQENAEVEERIDHEVVTEATAGVHFLTDDENGSCKSETAGDGEVGDAHSAASYEKRKNELLEYLTRQDGSVVCKLCGEVLASRTHWYRHKYKLHVSNLVNPVSLFKCTHCNVFFKSRKGYTGHIASRHNETPQETEDLNITIKEEPLDPTPSNGSRRKSDKSMDWEERREKEEKLVADIIDRVRRECEAQGGMVSRRGYSRRSTSIMNSA